MFTLGVTMGFYFVYDNRATIGYWAHPDLIDIVEEDKDNG